MFRPPPLRSRFSAALPALLAAACVGWLAPQAPAQALLELTDAPRPGFPATWEVTELTAHADVTGQNASVRLSQTFKNTGSQPLEARLLFPVPPNAAVRELTLLVDGKELTGTLQKAGEARETYEAIVRRNRDPALLEYAGYGLYRTSVFPIPKDASRTVQLRYTQLLGVREGLIDLTLPIGSAGSNGVGAKKVEVSASITTESPLKVVYSPTHAVEVDRPTDKTASAKLKLENVSGREDVRLLFGTAEGLVGLNVLTFRDPDASKEDKEKSTDDDGFFLLLAAPEVPKPDAAPPERTIVLVIDTSGSMAGEKMEQARNAASFIVGRLREGDTFNVIAYSSTVNSFRPELEKGDADGRNAGQAFVNNLRSGGGTDINAALTKALEMIPKPSEEGVGDRPTYLLFLTDGQPTSGVTDEQQIAKNVADANQVTDDAVKARLFTFGVGYDVNARLLDRLSGGGRGVSAYVAPEEDVEASVSDLYAKIAAPVLTGLTLDFEKKGGDADSLLNRVLPGDLPDLFSGQQLSIVGRYGANKKDLEGTFTLTGTSTAGDGEQLSFSLPVTLPKDSDDAADFLPALWATRRIGELLNRIDLDGENPELVEELVTLSQRYGILTPYTAFLAEEDVDLNAVAVNRGLARENLERGLAQTDGAFGVNQRAAKQSFRASEQAASPANSSSLGMSGPVSGAIRPQSDRGFYSRSGRMGGGMGGLGGGGFGGGAFGGGAPAPSAQPGQRNGAGSVVAGDEIEGLQEEPRQRVQRVAGETLFFKKGRWEQSGLTEEQQKDPVEVEQFTDAWFKLAKEAGERFAPLLSQAEPALVRIGGTTYLITPPAPEKDAAAGS
ncbi:VIT domain-containing protein [Alienimonas californiensis]|uniref:von Willebrand factor type A domain protein n=1 Tax=Alienimonas californiensis TaxID=2527989 RepID=A0A517PE96_9PLAN|nr:VIT domain-containing protein [Alienimonas californiensis]QDT17704.1 von Willebrand factor type A domain protein [Alienimonas californiensis]